MPSIDTEIKSFLIFDLHKGSEKENVRNNMKNKLSRSLDYVRMCVLNFHTHQILSQ